MANRTKVLETLRDYFNTKGRVLTAQEYSRETDTPVRIQQIRNIFGCWNRMEKLIMARERRGSDAPTNVNDIIAERNKALNDARNQWIEASENQDAKAVREAEAQVVAEKIALNASTPEGANANKIAIGGPLPAEQQQLHRMGATVEVDPQTREQKPVDVVPAAETVVNADPRTPLELKNAVAAGELTQTGTVEVGTATSGGSQGQPSVATVQALGGTDESEDVKPVVEVKDDKASAKKS